MIVGFAISPLIGLLLGYGVLYVVISAVTLNPWTLTYLVPSALVGAALFYIPTLILWPFVYQLTIRRLGQRPLSCVLSAFICAILLGVGAALLNGVPQNPAIFWQTPSDFVVRVITMVMLLSVAAIPAGWVLWRLFVKPKLK